MIPHVELFLRSKGLETHRLQDLCVALGTADDGLNPALSIGKKITSFLWLGYLDKDYFKSLQI